MPIQAVVFDAYGTLFDVYAISALAEQLYPEPWRGHLCAVA
jgi:2-haloacid dehalogenase